MGVGGGECCRLDGQNPRGGKGQQNVYLKLKKNDFLHPTIFKLFILVTGNPINNCDFFFKSIISVEGGHCDDSVPNRHKT